MSKRRRSTRAVSTARRHTSVARRRATSSRRGSNPFRGLSSGSANRGFIPGMSMLMYDLGDSSPLGYSGW